MKHPPANFQGATQLLTTTTTLAVLPRKEPGVWVSAMRFSPCEDSCQPQLPRGDRLVAGQTWGPTLTRVGGNSPATASQCQKHYKCHCVKCFKYIFLGKLFFKHVEYTGNLQGNSMFKTLFFFKGKDWYIYYVLFFSITCGQREAPACPLHSPDFLFSAITARLG